MIEARSPRMMNGEEPIASVSAGRTIDLSFSGKVSPNPPAGNHPVGMATSSSRITPVQNGGMLSPSNPNPRMA